MAETCNRIFYAVQQVGIAPLGSNTFTSVHGLQSIGINTTFNLEQVFEIGQISIYQNIENIPDIEVTMEKVQDGSPLLYHLLTQGATSPSLSGRQNRRAMIGLSVYSDSQDSASGTPLSQCTMSGVYVSSLSYTWPTEGNCTEQVTAVGNNKYWNNTFTADSFDNNDEPAFASGVQRRQDVMMGSGWSRFPSEIPGIEGDGYNYFNADGSLRGHISQVRSSTNLGREALYELGRRGPYFRYATFPVEVRTEIEIIYTGGEGLTALEDAEGRQSYPIVIKTRDGSVFDMGSKNLATSESYGGANAGRGGGNATMSFTYINYNDFTVTSPSDPSQL